MTERPIVEKHMLFKITPSVFSDFFYESGVKIKDL